MSKNKSIRHIAQSLFQTNTHIGTAILIVFVFSISSWIVWSDQKTGCTATLSIYNQYKNSISREVELENMAVALANFIAFKDELKILGVNHRLDLITNIKTMNEISSSETCQVGILSSRINIPLRFAYDIKGYIRGNISYYPSLVALIAIWFVTIFLILTLKKVEKYHIENEIKRANQLSLMAAQVSHDIRSPLSALNLMASQLTQISEDKRVIIRSAVNRINDISNELLKQSKEIKNIPLTINSEDQKQYNNILLSSLIDSIVSEKRIQYREKQMAIIEASIDQAAHGLFININPTELKRAISNLVNNSIEALNNDSGKVTVAITKNNQMVDITIADNGKGMTAETLSKLGTMGFSSGKNNPESGNGLGIYHAKTTVERAQGQFHVTSSLGQGTQIIIRLQITPPPTWFTDKIVINDNTEIISLDDDISIHQIWKKRFSNFTENLLITFTSGPDFESWVKKNNKPNNLYLIDYELLGQTHTGLDLIESLQIGHASILVTSRFEEDAIQARCKKLGIKLLPKNMAGFIDIEKKQNKEYIDAILIDDDSLMHSIWEMKADSLQKSIICFYTTKDVLANIDRFDYRSTIYIDSNLKEEIKGEEFAKILFDIGFKNIYLCTGKESSSFPTMPWIKKIIGKDPIFF